METNEKTGIAQALGLHLGAALAILLLEAAAMALVILLPRWLAGSTPSISQVFIFFLIGALAGYLAEIVLRGMRPLGYVSSILFAMVGAWIGSNVLPKAPSWDWPVSTSSGNVPILTSFVLAFLTALLWRALTGLGPLARRLERARVASMGWLGRLTHGPLNSGLLTGLVGGATLGWGAALIYPMYHRPKGPGFFGPLVIVLLTAALVYGWWRLLQGAAFRLFGRPFDRWWALALAGFCLGGAALTGAIVLLHRATVL